MTTLGDEEVFELSSNSPTLCKKRILGEAEFARCSQQVSMVRRIFDIDGARLEPLLLEAVEELRNEKKMYRLPP